MPDFFPMFCHECFSKTAGDSSDLGTSILGYQNGLNFDDTGGPKPPRVAPKSGFET